MTKEQSGEITPTTITDLHEASIQTLADQGIDHATLDPVMVTIATTDPNELREATVQASVASDIARYSKNISQSEKDELAEAGALANTISALRESIADPIRNRRAKIAAVGGLVVASLIVVGFGREHYNSMSLPDGARVHVEGGLIPGTTLAKDPNLLPDSIADKVPLLGAIPGIPDYGRATVRRPQTTRELVGTKKMVVSTEIKSEFARNPNAPDLTVSPHEAAVSDDAVALALAPYDSKNFDITSIEVHGMASDDYNGKLGIHDPEQRKLAETRADIGVIGLKRSLRNSEFKDDTFELTKSDSERVLIEPERFKISAFARKHNMTTREAVIDYEKGNDLPQDLERMLERRLGDNRGVSFKIEGKLKQYEDVTKFVESTAMGDDVRDRQSLDVLLAFFTLMFSGPSAAFAYGSQYLRRTQKRAQKICRKAGLQI